MFELIEKLRQKPQKVKKQVAFILALFISGLIFVVWLTSVYPNLKLDKENQEKISKIEPSPAGTFSETFSAGFKAMKDQISKFKDAASSFTTSPAYYNVASSTSTTTAQ